MLSCWHAACIGNRRTRRGTVAGSLGGASNGADMIDNALLVSLSRQVALRREMDVIANNVANINTSGFRSAEVLFEEHLMQGAEATANKRSDRDISYVMDRGTLHNFEAGALTPTDNPLDLAINGEGWFVVQTPQGERYTRNGGFQLTNTGHLVTSEGHRVLGDNGPMVFDDEDRTISIAGDGTVSTEAGEKGRLRVVRFADHGSLKAEGDTVFSVEGEAETMEQPRVVQGMIEKSNVKPLFEMSRMIEVTRAYTSMTSMIERADNLRRDAISALGRID